MPGRGHGLSLSAGRSGSRIIHATDMFGFEAPEQHGNALIWLEFDTIELHDTKISTQRATPAYIYLSFTMLLCSLRILTRAS